MEKSILNTIKRMLGIEPDYTAFDTEIIVHINSVLMVLNEIGLCEDGFMITGSKEKWDELLGDRDTLEAAKSYIYLKVRLLFDPPASQTVLDSFKNVAQEYEWRLYSKTGFKEGVN